MKQGGGAMITIFRFVINLIAEFIIGSVNFFKTQWAQYNALGQFLFILALAAIVIDASIAAQYGRSMSSLHAAGFAIVAICFCVLPDAAATEFRKRNIGGAIALGVACIQVGS